jgi:hypothetical protein
MLTSLVWMILERLLGFHDVRIEMHPMVSGFFAIPAIGIYVFALHKKDRLFYNNNIKFKDAFVTGILITLAIAILSPLTQLITSYIITPHYFNNVIHYSVTHKLMSETDANAYFNINNYLKQSVMGALIMGLVTSLIIAGVFHFKNRKK